MEYWKADSIFLHDDVMYELGFDSLIVKVIPAYDPFGETKITKPLWTEIVRLAEEMGGEIANLVREADVWAHTTFKEYEMFTILGL